MTYNAERKTARLNLRVRPSVKAAIEALSTKEGISVNLLVDRLLESLLRRQEDVLKKELYPAGIVGVTDLAKGL